MLYLECKMGAAGDMLNAALVSLVDRKRFVDKMNSLKLPGTVVELKNEYRNGIYGNLIKVVIDGEEEESEDVSDKTEENHADSHEHHSHHHHEHNSIEDIEKFILDLDLSDKVKRDAVSVYRLIADAEASAHGKPVEDIHFHEVGTMDAIADVLGVCILMEMINPDKVMASPINVGSGMVRCAHGILPVPAPATQHLLEGIPMYTDESVKAELCTPTGAALLRYFVDEFGSMPPSIVKKAGYGFGKKEFEKLNAVRAFLCENEGFGDRVVELRCNIDDMTPEDIGYAINIFLEGGAYDAFTSAIYMKKNRPATMLSVICNEAMRDKIVALIFKHTTTIGIRQNLCDRYVLERTKEVADTPYGEVRIKRSSGYGVDRVKIEYNDLARIADERDESIPHIKDIIYKSLE